MAEAEMKTMEESKPESKAADVVAPQQVKKLWGDEDDDFPEELEFKGLKVSEAESVDDVVDQPVHIKSEELHEAESTIKKVWPFPLIFVELVVESVFRVNFIVSESHSARAGCCG